MIQASRIRTGIELVVVLAVGLSLPGPALLANSLPAAGRGAKSESQPQREPETKPEDQAQPGPEAGEKPAAPDEKLAGLEATLRQLEKEISVMRGLEFKSPVAAKIIARPPGMPKGIRGRYDFKEKMLFVYDDVGSNYERGALVHEMIHALQDQHFNLEKLHQRRLADDAALARTALIEGDATLTMIELLKKAQPQIAKMLETPLVGPANRRNAFIYGAGARYVKALKQRGGWEAVNEKFRFPPACTAAILHPEGVKQVSFGVGTPRGELDILDQLARNPKTAPLAAEAAAGWKGDSFLAKGPRKRWLVAFETEKDALQFQAAMAKLRLARNPHLSGFLDEAGANAWHGAKGNVVAVLARGNRVLVLEAPDDAAYKALLDQIEGSPSLFVCAVKQRRNLTFGQLMDELSGADIVCIGETHNNLLHHRLQLQIIKALFARDERLAVGMEMFQRPSQDSIDRYLKNEISEEQFLRQSEYDKRWKFDWAFYRPVVEFCRRNGVPLAAINAPQELTDRISQVGHEMLTDDEKKQLGEIDFQVKEHRDFWLGRLAPLHGNEAVTQQQKSQAERSYQVMAVWDGYMAASAATFRQSRGIRRMVVLAGSGHVDRRFGIPARVAKRTAAKVVTLRIDSLASHGKSIAEELADYILVAK